MRTEARGLAAAAPGDVGPDEEGPPQASEHPQQDEGEELEHVPGRVVLHVKQHQATVPERVDGAQHERRHQSREERAPQSLQREIIADLRDKHISINTSTTPEIHLCSSQTTRNRSR